MLKCVCCEKEGVLVVNERQLTIVEEGFYVTCFSCLLEEEANEKQLLRERMWEAIRVGEAAAAFAKEKGLLEEWRKFAEEFEEPLPF